MTDSRVFISEADAYLFGQGTHYDIYKKLGAHPSQKNGEKGYFFGVWAPNAAQVYVIGDFNEWKEESNPMVRMEESDGIWTAFIPGSLCKLCGVQTGNSIQDHRSFNLSVDRSKVA